MPDSFDDREVEPRNRYGITVSSGAPRCMKLARNAVFEDARS
jgi:hypothetical protein